jgi:rhamnulose-1-phosphate aldolase
MNKYPQLNDYLDEIAETAMLLWERGWAERNAGNISINISGHSDLDSESIFDNSEFENSDSYQLNKAYPTLSGNIFLVTATGSRMREIAKETERYTCLIKISGDGNYYRKIPIIPGNDDIIPTSELPTHLAIHEVLALNNAQEKVVLHTHPTELIALSQIKEIKNEMNRILMGMHPENIIFISDGIGYIPIILPCSDELANATSKAFERHKIVLWEKHGCIAIGNNLNDAFDLIDTLAKSALMYFMVKAAGFEPEGLSDESLIELKKLSEKFK